MSSPTPAPAEALKPGTPEFLLASVANLIEILCDKRAEAEDKSWYAGPDCVPDLIRLSDHLRTALARAQAAEAERDSLRRAEGVAKVYLSRSDLPRMLQALEKLIPSVEVIDEKQQRRLDGTLMRAEMALQFVESGDGDAFEKVQVLEDAVRDFGLRLRERGLVYDLMDNGDDGE